MSGPSVMRPESPPLGTPYSAIVPEGSARPMPVCFVYQTLPSGPGAMPMGPVFVGEVLKRVNIAPNALGDLTTMGTMFNLFRTSTTNTGPMGIAPGPDGNRWDKKQNGIGQIGRAACRGR